MPDRTVKRRLKLILLFRSVPNDNIKLRELLERFDFIERFTPYVVGPTAGCGGGAAVGESGNEPFQLAFNCSLKVEP